MASFDDHEFLASPTMKALEAFEGPQPAAGGASTEVHRPQMPTPPGSDFSQSPAVPEVEESTTEGATEDVVVSVSTTFYPGAEHTPGPPDTLLLSSDSVFFYVHSHIVRAASGNHFAGILAETKDIYEVAELSTVLNIILHAVYGLSCIHYAPPFPVLIQAISLLPTYGVHPAVCIQPTRPLFTHLLSHAPLHPLEVYELASRFGLHELAVTTSSHLLSFPLHSLTDEVAERIGAVYLKRLFFLHLGRTEALKRALVAPPRLHPTTEHCDFQQQKRLVRAWGLAAGYLAWEARPDFSTHALESALNPLAEELSCELCRRALRDRVKELVVQWSMVKRSI